MSAWMFPAWPFGRSCGDEVPVGGGNTDGMTSGRSRVSDVTAKKLRSDFLLELRGGFCKSRGLRAGLLASVTFVFLAQHTNAQGIFINQEQPCGTGENPQACVASDDVIQEYLDRTGAGGVGPDSVGSDEVIDESLTSDDLATDSVGSDEIQTGAVGSDEVADESLTSDDLATDSVGSDEIQTGAVGSDEVADESLTSDDLATDSVGSDEIQTDAVGSDEIATGAVGSDEVADESLTSDDLATDSVGSDEIQTDAVGSDEIATGAVGSDEVADGSLTGVDIADDSIGGNHILADAIDKSHLADDSVGSEEIVDRSIRSEDIAPGAVTSTEIRNNTVLLEDLNREVTGYIDSGDARTLASANNYTDAQIGQVRSEIKSLSKEALGGVALALAAEVPALLPGQTRAISASYGRFAGHSAFALGGSIRIDETATGFGTLGITEHGDVGGSIGMQWAW